MFLLLERGSEIRPLSASRISGRLDCNRFCTKAAESLRKSKIYSAILKKNVPQVPLLNINLSDSFAFKKLPGIGDKYSSRIVRYRNLLGGFYAKEQLLEVYGIDSALFYQISPYILLEDDTLRKININSCGVKDLAAYPYVSYKLANLIVKYRRHHGNYSSL